jgi:hypothetical protein
MFVVIYQADSSDQFTTYCGKETTSRGMKATSRGRKTTSRGSKTTSSDLYGLCSISILRIVDHFLRGIRMKSFHQSLGIADHSSWCKQNPYTNHKDSRPLHVV